MKPNFVYPDETNGSKAARRIREAHQEFKRSQMTAAERKLLVSARIKALHELEAFRNQVTSVKGFYGESAINSARPIKFKKEMTTWAQRWWRRYQDKALDMLSEEQGKNDPRVLCLGKPRRRSKTKYRPGRVIHSMNELCRAIDSQQWIYVGQKPQHFGWVGSMQFRVLSSMLRAKQLRIAKINQ